MAHLSVRNFVCIDVADLEDSRFTVLIGPQASGKSVLAKLHYLFTDLVATAVRTADGHGTLERFHALVQSQFERYFPRVAWRQKPFNIAYRAGEYSIDLSWNPGAARNGTPNAIKVALSDRLSQDYSLTCKLAHETLKSADPSSFHPNGAAPWDLFAQVRRSAYARAREAMGTDFSTGAFFVPAGRSMFNYIGRVKSAVTDIELDPINDHFQNMLGLIQSVRYRHGEDDPNSPSWLYMDRLFDGIIENEEGRQFLISKDGRKIPADLLSSGMQELLPLWTTVEFFGNSRDMSLYVEEPEAHLFPEAQACVIEYLSSLLNKADFQSPVPNQNGSAHSLFITTHSPYVLSKINNLMKAGDLSARDKSKSDELAKIVNNRAWLVSENVRAYAIENRTLKPIISDGLIDSGYLDNVSNTISNEFLDLLAIEFPDE